MDTLKLAVQFMDRKEIRSFKVFAGRASEDADRKDLRLFEMIRQEADTFKEENAFSKIYGGEGKNNFYQLKNRLLDDINTSIIIREYREENNDLALFYSILGNYYYAKSNFELAFFYLRKAEKKAKETENYGLLDTIYGKLLRIAHELTNENLETYLQKRKENRDLLNKMSNLEDILEAVEYKMKISQNLTSDVESIKSYYELLSTNIQGIRN
jgi:hypothetical protein